MSENIPETTEALLTEVETSAPEDKTDWKAQARKWEDRAKANSKAQAELDRMTAAQQSVEEQAQAKAEAAEKRATQALRKIVEAEARSVLAEAGVPDARSLVEDMNLDRFIVDGDVDSDAIAKLADRYKSWSKTDGAKTLVEKNPAQGANSDQGSDKGQITREQLKRMTPEQRIKAQNDGLLNELLGIKK